MPTIIKCGGGITKSKYDALKAEKDALQSEYDTYKSSHSHTNSEYDNNGTDQYNAGKSSVSMKYTHCGVGGSSVIDCGSVKKRKVVFTTGTLREDNLNGSGPVSYLDGSDNNSSWKNIKTASCMKSYGNDGTYFSGDLSYRYYRIRITRQYGGDKGVASVCVLCD